MKITFSEKIKCAITGEEIESLEIKGMNDVIFYPMAAQISDENQEKHLATLSGLCAISKVVDKHEGEPILPQREQIISQLDIIHLLASAITREIRLAEKDNKKIDQILEQYGIERSKKQ